MLKLILPGLAGLICGVISGFGIGGGTLLILYMTLLAGWSQRAAQGVNLLYFLPTAAAAMILHCKNRLIDWHVTWPAALCGCATAAAASFLASSLPIALLRKGFGVFLLMIACIELRWKPKNTEK